MATNVESSAPELPAAVGQLLNELVETAKRSFQDDLRSIVLFGSGAEGRLRATSDLNLLFVLRKFAKGRIDVFRESLRVAQMAGHAAVMFVLEAELPAAAAAFAVKFDDIGRRRRVLYGDDVIDSLSIPRAAKIRRLQQVLLNLSLRLRERYAMVSLREEQLAGVIADAAGPLRSAVATLLELEGRAAASPKEALARIAQSLEVANAAATLDYLTETRQTRVLPAGAAGPVMFQLMALAEALRTRAERLT